MAILRPGEGARVTALGSTYTVKTSAEMTEGAYALVEEEFWGAATPLHIHTNAEEAFYVVSGHAAVWLDGAESEAGRAHFSLSPGEGHTHFAG